MKKLIIALSAVVLFSCSEDEDPYQSNQDNCECGTITSDRASDYSIVIRNSCSGNEKRFNLAQGDWMNAHPGSNYCITNTSSWRTRASSEGTAQDSIQKIQNR